MTKNITNAVLGVTLITLISKGIGFIRDIFLAASFGLSSQTDAFLMALSIIGILSAMILTSLTTTFIPVYSDYLVKNDRTMISKFLSVCYTYVNIITLIITAVTFLFSDFFVKVFAPNFITENLRLTSEILRILSITIFISGIVTLNSARLQSYKNYLIPAAIGFPMNLALILYMMLPIKEHTVTGLAFAYSTGILGQLLLQVPFMTENKRLIKLDFNASEPGFKRIRILVVPVLIGSMIQQINNMVDKILASGLPEGSISSLDFSMKLIAFIVGLMSAAVASVYYSTMSNHFSNNDIENFKKLLLRTTNILILIIVPSTVGFLVLRLPIVKLVFERGQFNASASFLTATSLFYYSFGLIGYCLRDVYTRAFYALKDTKTAMLNGTIAVVLNIVISISLVPFMGVGGIALGTSISAIGSTSLLIISLHKKIGDFGIVAICKLLFKSILGSVIMGFVVFYGYEVIYSIGFSNTLAVIMSIIMGIATYAVLCFLFQIDEINVFKDMIITKIKRM